MSITPRILPQADHLAARHVAPRFVVIHTTGRRLTQRAFEDSRTDDWPAVEEAAVRWYITSGQREFGGYLIGPSGATYQLALDDARCQHAAALGSKYVGSEWRRWARIDGEWLLHRRDPAQVWDWWDARWPNVKTPADLAGNRPNDGLGVDLLPMLDGRYSTQQTAALADLLTHLCATHAIPRDRRHILGHEDVDPCGRGTVMTSNKVIGKPWDPGALDWAALNLEP